MTILDVTAAIWKHDGCYLVARRAPGTGSDGRWEFPGGKIETGETPAACLAREMLEEFEVSVQVGAQVAVSVHEYRPGQAIRLLALEVSGSHDKLAMQVHDQIAWLPAKQILALDLLPADVPIAEQLAEADMRSANPA